MKRYTPDSFESAGHFGPYGGRYAPEMLIPALEALEKAYRQAQGTARLSPNSRNYSAPIPAGPRRCISLKT